MIVIQQLMTLAFMGGAAVITLALSFVIDGDLENLGWGPIVLVIAVAALIHLLVQLVGYRPGRVAGQTPAALETSVRYAFGKAFMLRLVMCEIVLMLCIAFVFINSDAGFPVAATGAVCTLLLMAIHLWPSNRVITKFEGNLHAQGVMVNVNDVLNPTRRMG